MMLTDRIAHAVAAGQVDVAYRRWKQARVQPGTTFRTVAGVVEICSIDPVSAASLDDAAAQQAGYRSLDELAGTFRGAADDQVYRIGLRWVGADPREALADNAVLTPDDIAAIDALLDRLDARTPWARDTLKRIAAAPGIVAGDLAATLPVSKESLKRRIRRLKEHGLTRSLPVGYELSARGHAYLTAKEQ